MPASKLSMHGAQIEGQPLMTTVTIRQLRLSVADDTTIEQAPAPAPLLRRVKLSLVPPTELAAAPAWDPHDVWLNRVKKPRDARAG
jgi:hypothetical protein